MKPATWIACATLVLAPIGFIATHGDIINRKIDSAFANLELLRLVIQRSAAETHRLPTEEEGLRPFMTGPGARIDYLPQDPWGHPYVYRRTAAAPGFVLYSMGADGVDDRGAGDDITTRDKSYRCETYYDECFGSPPWWCNVALTAAFLAAAGWLVFCAVRTRMLRARRAHAARREPSMPHSPVS
jgi:hypothetical protein